MAGKVRVVAPDGTRGEIPEANLMDAISQGYTPEADFEAQQREAALQAEYGDTAGQLMAGAQGAARGLTLGISDAASAALTGVLTPLTPEAPQLTPEARQRMAELGIAAPEQKSSFATGYDASRQFQDDLRAANPTTAVASEIGGAVLPALAGGGLSLAPAALAERAGASVAKGVAGAAPGLGRAALAGMAGGAVEGGLAGLTVGASRLTTEQMASPEEAAESVLSAAGEGLLLGGAIGGVLGAGQRLIQTATQRLDDAASAALAPPVRNPEMPQLVGGRHPADLDGITFDLEARPLTAAAVPDPARGKIATLMQRQQAAQGGFEQALQDGTAAIRSDLDNVMRDINAVDEWAGIAAKQRANALNVGHPVGTQEVDGLLGTMRQNLDAFADRNSAAALSYDGGQAALERVRNVIDDGQALVGRALAKGDVGEAYSMLDNLKRTIGRARGTRSSSVQDLMERQYAEIQGFMESEEIWGELASRQKVANAAWSNRISAGKDARVRQFTSEAGGAENRAANEWDQLKLTNSSSVHSLLQNVGDVRVADVEEAFRRNLRAMARDATERTKAWGSAELRTKAEGIVGAVKRIEDRMDAVALVRRDAMQGSRQLQSSAVDALASVAGVVNPAAGFAISGTARLGGRLLSGAADLGSGVRVRVANGAALLARGAAKVTALGASTAPVVAGSATGMLADDKYQGALQEAQAFSQAGSPQTQELIRQGAEIEKEDPALAEAFVQRTIGRAAYIADKLPKATSAAIFAPKPVLDPVTDRKLRRSVAAAYEPAAAIERIANMVGTPEDVDALKKLYPAMYKSFQAQVQQHLQQLDKPLDYQTAVKVAQLTGLMTVPGMEPKRIARAQRAAAMPDQQKAGEAQAAAKRKAGAPKFGRDRDNVYAAHADRLMDRE